MNSAKFLRNWLHADDSDEQKAYRLEDTNIDVGTIKNIYDSQKIKKIRPLILKNSQLIRLELSEISISNMSILDESKLVGLYILEKSQIGDLRVDSSSIEELTISDSVINEIHVSDKSHLGKVYINNCTINNIVIDSNSSIKSKTESYEKSNGDFMINNSTLDSFNIEKVLSKPLIIIENCKINKFSLSNSAISLNLTSNKFSTFNIHNKTEIESLKVHSQYILDGIIKNCNLNYLLFSGIFYKDSTLQINDVKIGDILIEDFINYGNLRYNNIENIDNNSKYKLTIINSDLGKTQFVSCQLNENRQLEFLSSKLSEILIIGSSLPSIIEVPQKNAHINQYEQKRLLLGQLRKVYEGLGDVVKASYYLAEGLIVLRLQFKQKPESIKDKLDYISLSMNFMSNRFGDSLAKSFFTLLSISVTLYLSYCLALGFTIGSFSNKIHIDKFYKLFGYYFEFINPTHKSGFITNVCGFKPDENGLSLSIGGLSQIVIAYLLYQFVAAFRKYGKRE